MASYPAAAVRKALRAFDANAIIAKFCDPEWEPAYFEQLAADLLRSQNLIANFPDAQFTAKRDEFVAALITAMDPDPRSIFEDVASQIHMIEQPYLALHAALERLPIAKLRPSDAVSEVLSYAVKMHQELTSHFHSVSSQQHNKYEMPSATFKSPDGKDASMDSTLEALFEGTSNALKYFAHRGKLFDADGKLALIRLPNADDEKQHSDLLHLLGLCWQSWNRAERRFRYLGGSLTKETSGHGAQATTTFKHLPAASNEALLDFVANTRLTDAMSKLHMKFVLTPGIKKLIQGISNKVPLPPKGMVSLAEIVSHHTLSKTFGFEISTSPLTIGTLTLSEWLRGFAVLHQLANDHHDNEGAASHLVMSRDALRKLLSRCGLGTGAEDFIDYATFGQTSRDLYDAPLLLLPDDQIFVFSQTLLAMDLVRVLLSVWSSLKPDFSDKGPQFEKAMLSVLNSSGIDARPMKFNIGHEEFQFDIVAAWGSYAFVFECKNYFLSANDPIRAAHFSEKMKAAATQANRLAKALVDYPQHFKRAFNRDVAEMQIVPCVLNSFPYSTIEPIDGVRICDQNVLRRFLGERFLVFEMSRGSNEKRIYGEVRVKDMWGGPSSTPEALMAEFTSPAPVTVGMAHTVYNEYETPLSKDSKLLTGHYFRRGEALELICQGLGVDPETVKKEVDETSAKLDAAHVRRLLLDAKSNQKQS